jgi:hypothetical protein
MASTNFLHANVGSAVSVVGMFKSYPKIGKVTFAFLSEPHLTNFAGVAAGNSCTFSIQESTDGATWTSLSGASSFAVGAGAQVIRTVLSQKPYLRIVGQGTSGNAGGKVKIDVTHNGIQYFGQMDIDVVGKSGYTQDGDTPTSANGQGTLGTTTSWPATGPTVSL